MIIGSQILDETGLPLPGANIANSNSLNNGTISDLNGNWQLNANENDILNFSFMGFKTVRLRAGSITGNIVLNPDTTMLSNVTVTAPQKSGMGLAGKLLLGGLFLGVIAKAIPGIIADNKRDSKGLKGFKKVSL